MKSVCSVSPLLQTLAAAAQQSSLAGVHTASSASGSPVMLRGGQLGRGPLCHPPPSPAPGAPAEAFLLLRPPGGQPLLLEGLWPAWSRDPSPACWAQPVYFCARCHLLHWRALWVQASQVFRTGFVLLPPVAWAPAPSLSSTWRMVLLLRCCVLVGSSPVE